MHLSIETRPPLPPARVKVGEWGGFLWYLKAWFACGAGGLIRIFFAYSLKLESAVGI